MPWNDGTLKFDLHRHFGGCISSKTVHTILVDQGHEPSIAEIVSSMRFNGKERGFKEFLAKFDVLNKIVWNEKAIEQSIEQVVRDQALEGVDYSEMSFSIDKYVNESSKWTRAEIIKYVYDVFTSKCERYNTTVNLILSLKMESVKSQQLVNGALVRRTDVVERLGGIDIVGDERYFDVRFYEPIFRDWRAAGKVTLAHAGETGPADNVFNAITKLHVHRVRHGVAIMDDKESIAAARDLNVCFDISLHSNYLVGTVENMYNHPMKRFLASKCGVTLGTDDPHVFGCTLDDEYAMAARFGLLGGPGEVDETVKMLRGNSIRFSVFDGCIKGPLQSLLLNRK